VRGGEGGDVGARGRGRVADEQHVGEPLPGVVDAAGDRDAALEVGARLGVSSSTVSMACTPPKPRCDRAAGPDRKRTARPRHCRCVPKATLSWRFDSQVSPSRYPLSAGHQLRGRLAATPTDSHRQAPSTAFGTHPRRTYERDQTKPQHEQAVGVASAEAGISRLLPPTSPLGRCCHQTSDDGQLRPECRRAP